MGWGLEKSEAVSTSSGAQCGLEVMDPKPFGFSSTPPTPLRPKHWGHPQWYQPARCGPTSPCSHRLPPPGTLVEDSAGGGHTPQSRCPAPSGWKEGKPRRTASSLGLPLLRRTCLGEGGHGLWGGLEGGVRGYVCKGKQGQEEATSHLGREECGSRAGRAGLGVLASSWYGSQLWP